MRQSSQISRELNGTMTEILLQNHADRVLVLVTQVGKVGNLIQATIPFTTVLPSTRPSAGSSNEEQTLPPIPTAIELTTLLGNAHSEHLQTLHTLYAAQIATLIWNWEAEHPSAAMRRTVVVGIALRKMNENDERGEKELFFQIVGMIRELLQQR